MAQLLINLIFLVLVIKYCTRAVFGLVSLLIGDVPYVPTSRRMVKEIIKRVEMKRGQTLVELGCGEGRVSIAMARKYPIKAIGVDKARWLLWSARWHSWWTWWKQGTLHWVCDSFFDFKLKGADVVYLYLITSVNQMLRPKLEQELAKGARVVAWVYPFDSPKFKLIEEWGKKDKLRIYQRI